MNYNWQFQYLGLLWKSDFNCWDLVKKIYQEQLNIDIRTEFENVDNPLDIIHNQTAFLKGLETWVEVIKPKEFDICAMGHSKTIHHVGVFMEPNHCFHITTKKLASAESLKALEKNYKTIRFYRHASCI